jgi:hypothetical protein
MFGIFSFLTFRLLFMSLFSLLSFALNALELFAIYLCLKISYPIGSTFNIFITIPSIIYFKKRYGSNWLAINFLSHVYKLGRELLKNHLFLKKTTFGALLRGGLL